MIIWNIAREMNGIELTITPRNTKYAGSNGPVVYDRGKYNLSGTKKDSYVPSKPMN